MIVRAIIYRNVLLLQHEKNGMRANNWNMVHLHNLIKFDFMFGFNYGEILKLLTCWWYHQKCASEHVSKAEEKNWHSNVLTNTPPPSTKWAPLFVSLIISFNPLNLLFPLAGAYLMSGSPGKHLDTKTETPSSSSHQPDPSWVSEPFQSTRSYSAEGLETSSN